MKNYTIRFGSGDPRSFSGLAPTLVLFYRLTDGQTLAAPAVSEILASTGIYTFQYGATQPIAFLADGATTGLASSIRYVVGQIDPADRADEYGNTMVAFGTTAVSRITDVGITLTATGATIVAIGNTMIALGTTAVSRITDVGITLTATGVTIVGALTSIGSTNSSFGSTSTDPGDLFGYMKRIMENFEGNETYIKSTGELDIYSRGSSTLLRVKTITNSVSTVIKI